MVKCKQCKKETRIVCLCGLCPSCNGSEDRLREFSIKLKGRLCNGIEYKSDEIRYVIDKISEEIKNES